MQKDKRALFKPVMIVLAALGLLAVYAVYPWLRTHFSRTARLLEWFRDKDAHPDWMIRAGEQCEEAPFIFPTGGYVGFVWGDSFRIGHRHQGIDIFSGEEPGITPVIAAYSGYLTRLPEWRSSLIIRIPDDPLQPGRQIWVYYTHLADEKGLSFISPEFPAGTSEKMVEAGTVLGYQGNYSGDPLNPVGVHLHFSIVLDQGVDLEHPLGRFRNELDFQNTLDPTPYLGLPLNSAADLREVISCKE